MANWIKLNVVQPDSSLIETMINADHYTDIYADPADADKQTIFKNLSGDVITIRQKFIDVQHYLRPLLIREDPLGNPV